MPLTQKLMYRPLYATDGGLTESAACAVCLAALAGDVTESRDRKHSLFATPMRAVCPLLIFPCRTQYHIFNYTLIY